jgi:CO dehydrogenase nickel-insertion accessory protein CooC1
MKVAVSGKGGVGKTLIAGGLARGFVERGLKTIAIDAEYYHNMGLDIRGGWWMMGLLPAIGHAHSISIRVSGLS